MLKIDTLKIIKKYDERGFSVFFEGDSIEKFHIVSLNPGAIRGNHVHDYTEIICVLGGKGIAEIELRCTGYSQKFLVDKDFQIIEVPPKIKHIVKNIGDRVFYLVCLNLFECNMGVSTQLWKL